MFNASDAALPLSDDVAEVLLRPMTQLMTTNYLPRFKGFQQKLPDVLFQRLLLIKTESDVQKRMSAMLMLEKTR